MPAPALPTRRRHAHKWIALALFLWLLGTALALWLWRIHDLEDMKARDRLQAQARVVHDNLGRQVEAVNQALLGLQNHVSSPRGVVTANAGALELLAAALPGVDLIAQLDAQGIVLASSRPGMTGLDRSDSLHFQHARSHPAPETLQVSAPYRGEYPLPTIALVHALRGADGNFAGIVEATLSPGHFKVLLSSVLFAPDMTATLVHGDGQMFVRLPTTPSGDRPTPASSGAMFGRHLASGRPATILRGDTLIGRDRVVAFHTLMPPELAMDAPLVVALGRDPEAMLEWWSTLARRGTALYVGVVLASLLAMSAWQRRRRRFDAISAEQQAALSASEARFRSLTRMSTDWYWEQDETLRFVRLEGDTGSRTRPGMDAYIGKCRWDIPALNFSEAEWAQHRATMQARLPFRDLVIARADPARGVSWVSISGEPVFDAQGQFRGYRGTGRDITEVTAAKEALRLSEERLQLVLRGSNDAPWDIDLQSNSMYYSDRWCALLGLDPKDPRLSPTFWRTLCHEDDRARVFEVLRAATEGDAQSYEVEALLRHRDGHYVPLLARGYILRDARGQAIRISGVSSDLSERKRAAANHEALQRAQSEQRLRELELAAAEQARALAEAHSGKLTTLLVERDRSIGERDQLLGLLAHEVRQPLNNASAALQGAALAMSGERLSHATAAERIERAQAVLGQVIDTVNNSLAASTLLTRPGPLSLQEFEIDTLIELALADLGPAARNRVVAQRMTGARTAEMNVALMRLALRNLLVNALTYSPENSAVELRVSSEDEPLSLVIEVADSGHGIPREQLPTLFERGSRGAKTATIHGAGLGLYVVARVVALHHGTVSVHAQLPQGSLFRVTLPQGRVN